MEGSATGKSGGTRPASTRAGGVVVQAQHHRGGLADQGARGGGVLAQFGGNTQKRDLRHALQALTDLQACGAGFAVDEDFGHGVLLQERRGAKGARSLSGLGRRKRFAADDSQVR